MFRFLEVRVSYQIVTTESAEAGDVAALAEPDDSYLNSGPAQETGKYKVYWDNGASACGTFDLIFDTAEEAEAYGKEWADECNLRDFGTTDPEHEGYSYDVIEVEEKDSTDI